MNLLYYELKKFLVDKRARIFILIFTFLLIGGVVRQEFLSVNESKVFNLTLQNGINYNIQSATQVLVNDGGSLSQEKKQELEEDIQLEESMLDALKHDDRNRYFGLRYQFVKQELEKSRSNDPMLSEMFEEEAKYINLVKERGLDFEYNPRMQVHAFGKLVTAFSTIFNSLWLLGFAMILTIGFAGLFENNEIRVYQSLDFKKNGIIIKKIFSSVSITYIWLILLSGLYLLSVGLIKGFGSPRYPAYLEEIPSISELTSILSSPDSASAKIRMANMAISNGEVILISLGYALIILFFLASLGMFLSTLTKRSMLVVGVVAILTEGYSSIQAETWIQPFRKFIPMSYLDPVNLLKYPAYLFNKNSLLFGVIYLSLIGVVLLFASYLILKNYRIRRI